MLLFKEAVKKAEEHGACELAFTELRKMSDWDDFWKHPIALEWAFWYAKNVIHGRWIDAEPHIMQDPKWVYCYAIEFFHGRWFDAEKYVVEYPLWACQYAINVIRGRWPDAESCIMGDPFWAIKYNSFISGDDVA